DEINRMAIQNQMGGNLSRRRDEFQAVYQHDTVLKPEDCGGPVVNLQGMAVGINIARAGRTETYVLPADLLSSVLEDTKGDKYPAPEWLLTAAPAPPLKPEAPPRRPQRPE